MGWATTTRRCVRAPGAAGSAGGGGFPLGATATVGANPPNGVVVNYYLKAKPAKEISLDFLDAGGKSVRKFTQKVDANQAAPDAEATTRRGGGGETPIPTENGFNTFVWNYRYPNATNLPGLILWGGSLAGQRLVPGNYQVL